MRALRRTAIALIAAAATTFAVTACDPDDSNSSPASLSSTAGLVPAAVSRIATTPPPPVDPYSTNGTWLVPSEIAPGNYRVIPKNSRGGYWETCADAGCDIDFDGSDHTGLIDNDNVDGPGVVNIPTWAYSIKLRNVRLAPIQ
ncbi:hypothetical protein [Nocardia africana]